LCILGAASWLLVDPSQRLTMLRADAAPVPEQNVKQLHHEPARG
jgi:hypothetical protein